MNSKTLNGSKKTPKSSHKLKNVLAIIFSTKALVFLMLLVQIIFYVLLIEKYYHQLLIASIILTFVVVIYIVNKDYNPAFKISWIVPIVALPVFGTLVFLASRFQITRKIFNQKIIDKFEETKPYLQQDRPTTLELEKDNVYVKNISKYVHHYAGYPIHRGTKTKYFPIGEDFFEDLKQELANAKHFIFMEFFIIGEGKMWSEVLEILSKKASEGVDVRLIYDGMGSQLILPHNYHKKLDKMGIKCSVFSPFVPLWSSVQTKRDHRKIVVIDGHTAYTGGVNLSDEYINHVVRFGHWKDTAIKIHGEAVVNFTMMFFNMWNYTNSTSENNYKDYFPHVHHPQAFTDDGYVMPYGDIPIDNENVGKSVYLDIINKAKEYVYIMTPYLILDNEMVTALSIASKSGIDVRIIVPGIPDKWYAYGIAQSFFKDLTKVGVRVYIYSKGFVHAKSFVSDDYTAVVGSINLDFRSLYLHFEDAVFMYKSSAVDDVKQDFLDTLKSCQLIDEDYLKNIPLWKKTINALLRMLSPML